MISWVEPADTSDRRAGGRLLAGLAPLFPRIHTVIADAGHESRKLARELLRDEGSAPLDHRSLIIYTIIVSSILYFQRNTTGAALISSKY